MELIKRLFKIFKSSNKNTEINELLISNGHLKIGEDYLKIENYPFEPSIAFKQSIFNINQIDDIDFKSYPPTFRVGNELIFLTSEKKIELEEFAKKNLIKTIERPNIWGWLLEPFLDTDYTSEIDERLTILLNDCGLTSDQIKSIREEVKVQMYKYNFDTMLWEWGGFDASDVLKAMRTSYNKEKYEDFYKKVMEIALKSKNDTE